MESAAKRKAASGATTENDARPAKRQKVPKDANATDETPESTTIMGLKFLDSVRIAKDKNGRSIATHFLTLPSKDDLPEYYEIIKLPMTIEMMDRKLKAGEYKNLAQVESDIKRLVNNAKMFNDKKSLVYEDAERLRKTASNWMTKHNPAYRDKSYQAIATPIPGEDPTIPGRPLPRRSVPPPTPTPDTTERPRRAAAPPQPTTPAPSRLRHSTSVAPATQAGNRSFDGKTFQQAQEQIINGLIEYIEPGSGLPIFQPFVVLPSRSLKDYYHIIKRPMSLNGVLKRVKGVVGRNAPTGITNLTSWAAFEEEVSWIWKNARDYNEDGSDLYNLSIEFEELFKKWLAEAKAKVEEPPQPKLKLNMSAAPKQQLKLKLRHSPSSDPNTPGTRSSGTPGVIVDSDALQRQQRHVHDSMPAKPQTPLASATPIPAPRGLSSSIAPAVAPPAVNGIKKDMQSPALNSIRPVSLAPEVKRPSVPSLTPHPAMPPPPSISRPTSGSPHPNGAIGQQTGIYSQPQPQPQSQQYHPPPQTHHILPPPPPRNLSDFRKKPLRNASEALIPKITIRSAPSLGLKTPFKQVIKADLQKTCKSITIPLPQHINHIQISPFLPVALDGRGYRVFYTLNGKIYSETPRQVAVNGMGVNGMNGVGIGVGGVGGVNGVAGYGAGGMYEVRTKGEPLYDAKLVPGVNRIEIEVVAEPRDGAGGAEEVNGNGKVEVLRERFVGFVHLMG